MTLLTILVAAFILVVFIVCLAIVTGKELRRSREDRESREAYEPDAVVAGAAGAMRLPGQSSLATHTDFMLKLSATRLGAKYSDGGGVDHRRRQRRAKGKSQRLARRASR